MSLRNTLALLVCAAALASAQTTYSSPVRVTNTTLPVEGAVRITGNTPVVTPSGVPLQVKAFDTLPVAHQGPLAVTPQGGAMPVTGSVNLTGSPTVAISAAANTVQLPRPVVFTRAFDVGQMSFTVGSYGYADVPIALPPGDLLEITSISGYCSFAVGNKLTSLLLSYLGPDPPIERRTSSAAFTYTGPLTDQYGASHDLFHFDRAHPLFVAPSSIFTLKFARSTIASAAGGADCRGTIQGKIY